MFGLSIANVVSGLVGGMPATAALARTSLNVKTGADNKMSATINSVSVFVLSYVLLKYLVYLPLPVIAAILMYVAWNMIEVHQFKKMFKLDKAGLALSILVALITVYKDPIVGILTGTAIALLIFVEKISRGQAEVTINDVNKKTSEVVYGSDIARLEKESDTLVYDLKGQLVYLNSLAHVSRFEHYFHGYNSVILRLRNLHMMDIDGVEALEEIIDTVTNRGKNIYITGVNPLIFNMMQSSPKFLGLVENNKVFVKTGDALRSLGYQL
jgi:SulP family sulfate permease